MPLKYCFGGPLVKAGVPTSGVAQVETADIVGTITLAGNATFTITSALVTGSPLAVSVAVALNDTASQVATKAAAVFNATAAITAHYVALASTSHVKLTAIKSAANDATLNIAFTNDDCTGLTPDASSTHTTAGVLGDYHGAENLTMLQDTTNLRFYQNTGDENVPTWTAI